MVPRSPIPDPPDPRSWGGEAAGPWRSLRRRLQGTLPSYALWLACLLAIPMLGSRMNREPSRPGLPPGARARIETRGRIVQGLAFDPRSARLFSSESLEDRVRAWDPASGRLRADYRDEEEGPPADVTAMALAPDGRALATSTYGRGVALWDLATGTRTLRLPPASWHVRALAFTPDGRALVAAGVDGMIRTWDAAGGRERRSWRAGGAALSCLDIAPDGRTLVVGSLDGWLGRWDLDGGRPPVRWPAHASGVLSVDHAPDGRTLASGAVQSPARLWDATTGRALSHVGRADEVGVLRVAYAPDGAFLATGHADHVVRLWDPGTGRLRRSLPGHRQPIRALAFSADGRTLASGASDATIFVWDLTLAPP